MRIIPCVLVCLFTCLHFICIAQTDKEKKIEELVDSGVEKTIISGDFDGGISDFNKALEIDPNSILALNGRGVAYLKNGEYLKAIADFEKINKLFYPIGDDNALLQIGRAKVELKEYQEAIAYLKRSIELNPNYSYSYYYRGRAKDGLEDYRGAILDYSKAIVLDEKNYKAYFNRAIDNSLLGDFNSSILDCEKLIEANLPEYHLDYHLFVKAYFWRGMCRIELGQKDNGCLDLSKAGELGYSYAYDYIKQYCK